MAPKTNIKSILPWINQYKLLMDKRGYSNAKYILFGSWAKGTIHQWSDIDLCVVSDKFNGNLLNVSDKLRIWANEINYDLEPIAMRPEDLADKTDTLASEVNKWGIVV